MYIPKGYLCLFRLAIKDAPNSKLRLIKSTTLSPTKERMDMELDRIETTILSNRRIYNSQIFSSHCRKHKKDYSPL